VDAAAVYRRCVRVLSQGFLRKEGRTKGSWKRRWFILRPNALEYMKRPDAPALQGSIPIANIRGVHRDQAAYPLSCCFQLVRRAARDRFCLQLLCMPQCCCAVCGGPAAVPTAWT
jgi:hypothetical protein